MAFPRKRVESDIPHKKSLEKQQLRDCFKKLFGQVGSYLVLIEEGSMHQAVHARNIAKSDFHKIGPEMKKMAFQAGEKFPLLIEQFLAAVEGVVLSATGNVDAATIKEFNAASRALEKAL